MFVNNPASNLLHSYTFCSIFQEEGDGFLETYSSENDGEEESTYSVHSTPLETNFPHHFQNEDSQAELEVPQQHLHPRFKCASVGADPDEEDNYFQ